MHPLVHRMPCHAVRVAGEHCAEPAFRVAASFMSLAKAAASALACSVVMPRRGTSQFGVLLLAPVESQMLFHNSFASVPLRDFGKFLEAGHAGSLCWRHLIMAGDWQC